MAIKANPLILEKLSSVPESMKHPDDGFDDSKAVLYPSDELGL